MHHCKHPGQACQLGLTLTLSISLIASCLWAAQMPLCLPALKYPEVLSVMAARGIDKFFDHPLMFIALSTHLMLGIAIFYVISWLHHKGPAYLIDFYTFRGPDHLSGSNAEMVSNFGATQKHCNVFSTPDLQLDRL